MGMTLELLPIDGRGLFRSQSVCDGTVKLPNLPETLNSSARIRTGDLGLMNPALYQLSYAAVLAAIGCGHVIEFIR
jgi:hypothetical protein